MWISRMTIVLVLLLVVLLFLLMMYFAVDGAKRDRANQEEAEANEKEIEWLNKAKDEYMEESKAYLKELVEVKAGKAEETNAPFELQFNSYCKGCVKCKPYLSGYYARYANGEMVSHGMKISCEHIQECEYIRGLK